MIGIVYRQYQFSAQADGPYQGQEFSIAFRSLLGKVLHEMVCKFSSIRCPNCLLRQNCDYTKLFETSALDKPKGPIYVINLTEIHQQAQSKFKIEVVLFSNEPKYHQDFWVKIFQKMGTDGVGKSRTQFQINFLGVEDHFMTLPTDSSEPTTLNLKTLSPLRIIKDGVQSYLPSYSMILQSAYHRLMDLYPELRGIFPYVNFNQAEQEKNISAYFEKVIWNYYSTRQKKEIVFSGVEGRVKVAGNTFESELFLLRFGEIAGIGKSIRFGLGHYRLE